MNIVTCKQGTSEWFSARAGKVTASEVADALAFLSRGDKKGKESASRYKYKIRIACETLSKAPIIGGYLSPEMQHGNAFEAMARTAYELRNDLSVDQVGLVIHPTIPRAAASPDGIVGNSGLVEIKAPRVDTHIAYMDAGVLPEDYEPQVMWQLACTEREWCDFVSFSPAPLPSRYQLFTTRVYRNDKRIAEMEAGVLQFLSEVDEMIERLGKLTEGEEEARVSLQATLRASVELPEDWDEQLRFVADSLHGEIKL